MPILLKNLVSMERGNDVVASLPRTIWIADQVRNDVDDAGALFSPSDPSVRHWDRPFDSSPIKGEGIYGWCCLVATTALPLWIADQVRNDGPPCPHPVDTALKPV